jgi:hypothetical protein
MNINELVQRLVAEQIEAAVKAALNGIAPEPPAVERPMFEPRTRTATGRRPGFVSKLYRPVVNRRGNLVMSSDDIRPGNDSRCWAFIVKSVKGRTVGVSAKMVEQGTGLGRKAVESSLYGLRTLGAIESFPTPQK